MLLKSPFTEAREKWIEITRNLNSYTFTLGKEHAAGLSEMFLSNIPKQKHLHLTPKPQFTANKDNRGLWNDAQGVGSFGKLKRTNI